MAERIQQAVPEVEVIVVPTDRDLDAGVEGLVGLGGIGGAVARRALPFGMRVVAFRRTDAPSPIPDVELVRSLPELIDVADHVVITAPATRDTHHMIDASALARMKPTAHLV